MGAAVNLSVAATGNNGSWGVHGRILPYLEQGNLYNRVDLTIAWDTQLAIDGLKLPMYACPSDPRSDEARSSGGRIATLYSTTHGFNYGTWFVFNPSNGRGGDGMFFPNASLSFRDAIDGSSNTLLTSEVKAWTPYFRNGGPSQSSIPQTVAETEAVIASGTQFKNTGHTEWPDGCVHHTGFTVTLTPNSKTSCSDGTKTYAACDYNSWQEGKNGGAGNPSFAIITSRSYHTGTVKVLLFDGSTRSVSENIDLSIWRGLGTRAGGEVISEF